MVGRAATSIRLSGVEMDALGELARQRGIIRPRGVGRRFMLGNASELFRRIAAGTLCLYDPVTEIAISREEYARLMAVPN